MEPSLSEAGDLDAAIEACERELDENADPAVIEQLAGLYARRDGQGDREQAADLYATLGDALGDPDGIPWLERALELMPSHDEARASLAQLTHAKRMVPRTGRTQVGFKLDLAAEESAPLATLDGTAIPPSVPPPAADVAPEPVAMPAAASLPQQVEASAPPRVSSVAPSPSKPPAAAPLAAASWPPVAPRRSVAPAASPSRPPRSASSVPPQPMAAAAPVAPPVATKSLDEELESMAGGKRALPDKRWLIGGAVAACAMVGGLLWSTSSAPEPVAVVPSVVVAPTAPPSAAPPITAPAPVAAAAATPQVPPLTAEAIGAPAPAVPEAAAVEPAKSGPQVEALWKLASVRGGKIADDALAQAFEKAAPKLDRCYAQSLKKKPRTQGRITLGFMVRTNGRAMRVKPVSATLKDKALSRCAASAVASTRFPKPRKNAQVRLPIEFSPG